MTAVSAPVPRAQDPGRDARTAPRPARRAVKPELVLLIAAAGVFMEFVDTTLVNIAFPEIRAAFPAAGTSVLAWVFNAYSIVFAALLVAGGSLADLFGRKRGFAAGLVVFTIGSAGCAVAPSVGFLIAARAVQALGGALAVPAAAGLVSHAYPSERRASALAALAAVAAIAAALGPPLGGLLINAVDWRFAFLVNVPVGIVAIVAASRLLVESRTPGRRALPDLVGAGQLAVAIGLLTLGIVESGSWGWGSVPQIAVFLAAVGLGAVFVRRCGWHTSPALDLSLYRERPFAVANAGVLVSSIGFYGYYLCYVLFLITVWGYSTLQAGTALVPGAVTATVVAGVAGRVADRRGFRVLIVPGALVLAGAMVYYQQAVGDRPAFLSEWLPGQLLAGVGAGLTLPMLNSAAAAAGARGGFARAGAMASSARQLGAALGAAIMLVIILPPTAAVIRDGWMFAAGCFVVVSALSLALGAIRPVEVIPDDDEVAVAAAAGGGPGDEPEPDAGGGAAPTAPLLAALEPASRAALLAGGKRRRVAAGEWLFRAGEVADALYVVEAGRFEVLAAGDDERLRETGRGGVLGELGVLAGTPRSASVRAVRDAIVRRLDRDALAQVLEHDGGAARALVRELAVQLQASRPVRPAGGDELPAVIALVGVGAGAPLHRVAGELAAHLEAHGTVARLERPADGRGLAEALDAAEREHDRVLLDVDLVATPGEWVGFALRQADRVVVVGAGDGPPLDLAGLLNVPGPELLLAGHPADAEAWRDGLAPLHIGRLGDPPSAAVARLARRLCGRATGVVLSGGGARALAHLGVLEALEDAGVAVDRFGGAGVGALVAAMAAQGWTAAEIDAQCYEELVQRSPFGDWRPGRTGLVRGERLRGALERIFGDAHIEELPHPFFAVSADLMAGELVTDRRGRVADVLYGALTIPGLMSPHARGDRLLVDGGLLDELPVAVMAREAEGPVLAADVSGRARPPVLLEPPRRGGRRAGAPPPVPSLREALGRAVTLGGADPRETASRFGAVAIEPDVDAIGRLEFHQIDEARAAGRRAARRALPAILRETARP